MSGDVLSPEDRAYVLKRTRRSTNSAVHRRMNVLLLLDDGWSMQRVCEALFIDDETVRDHRRLREKDGRPGVKRLIHSGGTSGLPRDEMTVLAAWFDEAAQRAFVEATLRPLMEGAGKTAPLYFADATHPS